MHYLDFISVWHLAVSTARSRPARHLTCLLVIKQARVQVAGNVQPAVKHHVSGLLLARRSRLVCGCLAAFILVDPLLEPAHKDMCSIGI